MADLTVTANSVVPVADVNGNTTSLFPAQGIAGEAITQGQPVYRKASDGKLYKADANVTSAEAEALGIALSAGASGQYITYWSEGTINLGATLVVGTIYIVSVNAGGIAPISDLATSSWVTILCYAETTSVAKMLLTVTGVQKG